MMTTHDRPSAVVADGRALGRNLMRFLLEEQGYGVVVSPVLDE